MYKKYFKTIVLLTSLQVLAQEHNDVSENFDFETDTVKD